MIKLAKWTSCLCKNIISKVYYPLELNASGQRTNFELGWEYNKWKKHTILPNLLECDRGWDAGCKKNMKNGLVIVNKYISKISMKLFCLDGC